MRTTKFLSLALAVLAIGLLGACSNNDDRLDDLEKKLYTMETCQVTNINSQIKTINTSIADLETLQSNVQRLMKALSPEESSIESFKAADETIGKRIDELKDFVEKNLKNYANKDWTNATFATLQQYETTCDTIAKIDARIGDLDEKISTDIEASAQSLKSWVNEQFDGYYTAAQMDATVDVLQGQLSTVARENKAKADSIAQELTKAKAEIANTKAEIRAEYKAAIETAINEYEGRITSTLQKSIGVVNARVAALEVRVKALEADVAVLTGRIIALEQMIQTVAIVPAYSDGSVEATNGMVSIDCIIKPLAAVRSLTKDNFKILVNRFEGQDATMDTIAVSTCVKDEAQGTATIKADIAKYVPEEGKSVTVAVEVKNGLSEYVTEFANVVFTTNGQGEYEAIDLGLPSGTLWASCNVGATKPEEYGGYFAWGETEEKDDYSLDTYLYFDAKSKKYQDIGSDIAGTQYDVAHVRWGGSWQMPTKAQIQELIDNCKRTWTQLNGVKGMLVTGPNGNQIFLPATGYRWDDGLRYEGSLSWYQSSTFSNGFHQFVLQIDEKSTFSLTASVDLARISGLPVRAVCPGRTVDITPPTYSITNIECDTKTGNDKVDVSFDCKIDEPLTNPDIENYGIELYLNDGEKLVSFGTKTTHVQRLINDSRFVDDRRGARPVRILELNVKFWYIFKNDSKIYHQDLGIDRSIYRDNSPEISRYAIDLGLPSGTKWASCNVGANKPEEYGGYFAWGETEEKDDYSMDTYLYYDAKTKEYQDIGNDIAGTEYDVAHVRWGGSWQMPTLDQVQELLNNCTQTRTQLNGVNGILVTGLNGHQIFLPAAGYHWGDGLRFEGRGCYYWLSTFYLARGYDAYYLFVDSSRWYWDNCDRRHGLSVRAVCP